jgi:predicted nicotinamide N-methyase
VQAVDWTEPPLHHEEFDLIFCVDVIFNEALAVPLINTLSHFASSQTLVLVALELRSDTMVEHFLSTWTLTWDVWRLSCHTQEMQAASYVVWLGRRKLVS